MTQLPVLYVGGAALEAPPISPRGRPRTIKWRRGLSPKGFYLWAFDAIMGRFYVQIQTRSDFEATLEWSKAYSVPDVGKPLTGP